MSTRRVVVTGGNGLIGSRLVPRLIESGYDVTTVGREPWPDAPCLHTVCDLCDYGSAIDALRWGETIVHLGAHSMYVDVPDNRTFNENVVSTFNVFRAAYTHGVQRVVWASSVHATGQPFSEEHALVRVPMLESDLYSNADAYGLSKRVCESMMGHPRFWGDLQLVAIRVSWAMEEDGYAFTYVDHVGGPKRGFAARWPSDLKSLWADPSIRLRNLWGYVDGRDLFQAFRLAIESEKNLAGQIFHITAADTIMNVPTRELVARFMPSAVVAEDLGEFGSLYSIQRAREELGYSPQYSCRDMV